MPRKRKEKSASQILHESAAVKTKLKAGKQKTGKALAVSQGNGTKKGARSQRSANKKNKNDNEVETNETESKSSPYFTFSEENLVEVAMAKRKKRKSEPDTDTSLSSKIKKLKSNLGEETESDCEFEEVTANYRTPESKRKSVTASKSKKDKADVVVEIADKGNEKYNRRECELGESGPTCDKIPPDEAKCTSRVKNTRKQNKKSANKIRSSAKTVGDVEVSKVNEELLDTAAKVNKKGGKKQARKQKNSGKTSEEVSGNKQNRMEDSPVHIAKSKDRPVEEEHKTADMSKELPSESSDDEMMEVDAETPLNVVESLSQGMTTPTLPKSLDHSDAMALLLHMEGPKPSASQVNPSTSRGDDGHDVEGMSDDDDSEEEDWEDVEDHHGNSPKKSQLPSGPVEITLEAPVIYKKRKKGEFDLQAYFKRQINKFKREVAMDIHKVHLLCLLARCQYLNGLCQDPTLKAQALSVTLVTKELKLPAAKSRTETHIKQVLTWIQQKKEFLLEIMKDSLTEVTGQLKVTLICVILLRQVGFLTRLMASLQPVPFKEPSSKAAAAKKGKSKAVTKKTATENSESKAKIGKLSSIAGDKKDDIKSNKRKNSKNGTQKVKKEKIKHENMDIENVPSNSGMCFKNEMENEDATDVTVNVKQETIKGGRKPVKRRSSDRKCSKMPKGAYKEPNFSQDENCSDADDDDDYKPEIRDDNEEPRIGKGKFKKTKRMVEHEIDTEEEENQSDSDFEEENILLRTQQLRRQSSAGRNKRILSTDIEDSNSSVSGVDHWVEVYQQNEQKWKCVDCVSIEIKKAYEIENQATQPVRYIVGITEDGYMRDVTARYASQWLTDTRKQRVDTEWWAETLEPYRCTDRRMEELEDQDMNSHLQQRPLPTSIGAFKSHPLYALKRHLLKFEAIYPDTSIPLGYIRGEPVYARECVHTLHSRENWLKEGRAVRIGEEPYKFVKSRPKWNKPKEDPEAKDLELFGQWQTEVYIPPPAVDGKVPRNAHGNVEMFLPSMLPAGTVHLKIPGLNKIAKKLDIDCAPAMVGWDHHCGFSHPLMDGWIVCEEHKDILLAAWDEEQEIIREKEQQKREKRVYDNWRKLIRGMLIKERLKKRFDLEEKPVDGPECEKLADSTESALPTASKEEATDLQHSWPQNRLPSGQSQHTLCTTEKL